MVIIKIFYSKYIIFLIKHYDSSDLVTTLLFSFSQIYLK